VTTHILMRIGLAVMLCAGAVCLAALGASVWRTHPADLMAMNVAITALFVVVAGFGVFVVGFCIDMTS
jgi:hypothetical protein